MEARDRLGGRLHTVSMAPNSHPFEMGAQWLHSFEKNPLAQIITEAATAAKNDSVASPIKCFINEATKSLPRICGSNITLRCTELDKLILFHERTVEYDKCSRSEEDLDLSSDTLVLRVCTQVFLKAKKSYLAQDQILEERVEQILSSKAEDISLGVTLAELKTFGISEPKATVEVVDQPGVKGSVTHNDSGGSQSKYRRQNPDNSQFNATLKWLWKREELSCGAPMSAISLGTWQSLPYVCAHQIGHPPFVIFAPPCMCCMFFILHLRYDDDDGGEFLVFGGFDAVIGELVKKLTSPTTPPVLVGESRLLDGTTDGTTDGSMK